MSVFETGTKRIHRAALKERQQEIVECLISFGLMRGPRRLLRDDSVEDYEKSHRRRLRLALERLGPTFSAFGLYMASRIDLLPTKSCFELAAIPDSAAITSAARIKALVRQELGCEPENAFLAFEELPFESRLLFQSHRALLRDGTPAIVKLIHPEADAQLSDDLELLPLVKDAFAIEEENGGKIASAIEGFSRAIRQQLDLTNEAGALGALAQDAEELETLRVPAVQKNLCAPYVLTIEQLDGERLDDVLALREESGIGPRAGTAHRLRDSERFELARLLCLVWLKQTLHGRAFPVEPRASNILVLPRKQIAFTGGLYGSLGPEAKANLWDYLVAVSTENPDRACTCLLRELKKEREAINENLLRQRFRQAVPFRDGGWNDGDNLSLAEHLFLHWRFASEQGYLPQPYLPDFYRGLFTIADLARQLAPERDVLLEGWRDVRLLAGLAQMKEMVGLHQLGDQADKYAAMMMELPQRLDDALTRASDGGAHLKLHFPETREQRRKKNGSVAVLALLLFLVGVALLSHHVASSFQGGLWTQRVGAVAFLLFGIMLLRAAGHIR